MSRRDWPLRFSCKHPGCTEHVTYRYDTRRDLAQSFELKHYGGEKGWRCTRHAKPAEVLSVENIATTCEMTIREEAHGKYFGSSGFVFGPGFKAFAADFPAGAKLIVTARIELPTEPAHDQ